MEPLTPPRAPANTPISVTPALPGSEKSRQRKRKTSKARGGAQHIQSSASRKDSSPRPSAQVLSGTPARNIGTPSQAYAGPTFHASPAPSSLPIPKFFSKTLSPPEEPIQPKEIVQRSSSEGSSVVSENSPIMRNALSGSDAQIREASPLDIFFNADRQEKAKRQLNAMTGLGNENIGFKQNASQSAQYLPVQSSSQYSFQGLSKHSAGNSLTSNLPLEMDASRITETRHPDPPRSNTSPSILTTQAELEQQRKAKTIALKKLLMSPPPQRPSSASSKSSRNSQTIQNFSPSPSPRPLYPVRSSSNPSAPTRTADSRSGNINYHESSSVLPSPHPSHAFSGSRSSKSRPTSSYLRQELLKDTLVETSELPSTPTPTRSHNVHNPRSSKNSYNTNWNGNVTPSFESFQSATNVKTDSSQDNGHTEIMEDALRKMLKINVLGQDSVTGVRA